MYINQLWLRTMGVSGILGGLILFAGDMLFYYNGISTDLILNMANASDIRIISSAFSALLGSWLYMLGLGQVHYAFEPSKPIIRIIVVMCFAAILLSYGVVHGAYVAIAATAKLALENNLDLENSTTLASNINQALRLLVYPVFAILSVFFITQVWKRKTLYPRWIIAFFPLMLFMLQGMFSNLLSGSIHVVVIGGYLNLLLVLFFTASTVALWNKKISSTN